MVVDLHCAEDTTSSICAHEADLHDNGQGFSVLKCLLRRGFAVAHPWQKQIRKLKGSSGRMWRGYNFNNMSEVGESSVLHHVNCLFCQEDINLQGEGCMCKVVQNVSFIFVIISLVRWLARPVNNILRSADHIPWLVTPQRSRHGTDWLAVWCSRDIKNLRSCTVMSKRKGYSTREQSSFHWET